MIKKRVIVDYKNVPDEVLQKLAEKYPHGYTKAIIKFTNAKNEVVSAVPIEVDDTAYLVKVSTQLQKMVDDYESDDDFDVLGLDADTGGKAARFDDEDDDYGDDDDSKSGYGDDDEESLDDHLDEAENIADDSDY